MARGRGAVQLDRDTLEFIRKVSKENRLSMADNVRIAVNEVFREEKRMVARPVKRRQRKREFNIFFEDDFKGLF